MSGRGTREKEAFLFLAPALVLFLLFSLVPALWIFVSSFRSSSFTAEGGWVGWGNYVRVLTSETTLYALFNSLVYLLATPAVIIFSLILALVLDEGLKGARFFRSLFFLPVVTPMIVVGLMWRWILNEDVGLLNYLLAVSGITDGKVPWLSLYPVNLLAVMGVTVWRGLGYYALIFLAALMAIPKELEESAEIDGCAWLDVVRWVKLPSISNVIVLAFVLSSISALKAFDEIAVILPNSPLAERTTVPLIYEMAFIDLQVGPASVLSVILFILTLGFSYVITRRWGRG